MVLTGAAPHTYACSIGCLLSPPYPLESAWKVENVRASDRYGYLLFTDIEGSAQLWEQFPEAMKTALAKHDLILRQAVKANGGYIVKTARDSIHAVFETAVNGVSAALAAQLGFLAETWEMLQLDIYYAFAWGCIPAKRKFGQVIITAVSSTALIQCYG